MIMAPNRVLRLWKARLGIRGRLRELTAELKTAFPQLTRVVPSAHSGGFDSIYFLEHQDAPFAVLRLNNPHQRRKVVHSDLPRVSPSPAERIEREWSAYSALAPLGVAPAPLWRANDAIVCSYSTLPRLRKVIEDRRGNLADIFTAVFNAVGRMHSAGITQLDLSPGNILVCPESLQVLLIDFEYVSQPGRTFAEDCAFDWHNMFARTRQRAAVVKREREIDDALDAAVNSCDHRERVQAAVGERRAA